MKRFPSFVLPLFLSFALLLLGATAFPARVFAQAGRIDPTFNPNFGALGGDVSAIAYLPDGKIVVGGAFQGRLLRLNADGTPDPTFVNAGLSNTVRAIVVQPDGKLLVGGDFGDASGLLRRGVARLNADGSLDTTFQAAVAGNVHALALLPSGKIIIGGSFPFVGTNDGLGNNGGTGIARLNADGSLDDSYVVNEGVGNDDGSDGVVNSLFLLPDGSVYFGGHFSFANGFILHNVGLLDPDGNVDVNFNPQDGPNGDVNAIFVQPDFRVLVAGDFTEYDGKKAGRIVRLKTSGEADRTFKTGSGASDLIYSIGLRANGRIVIAGFFSTVNGFDRNQVAQLEADGSVDAFDFDRQPVGGRGFVEALAIDNQGRTIIAGNNFTLAGTDTGRGIARLKINGTVDRSFGSLAGAVPGLNGSVFASAALADGRVYIAGRFTAVNGIPRAAIARLNADGSLDGGFDPGAGVSSQVSSLAVQADGKVIVGGGFNDVNGFFRQGLARFNPDGSVDEGFDTGDGKGALSGSSIGSVTAIAVQADGRIVIGGEFVTYGGVARNHIARLNADGTLDPTFDPGSGPNAFVQSLAVQPDGKILAGGQFTAFSGQNAGDAVRLNTDGSVDASFNTRTGANDTVLAITVQPDGNILLGGFFTTYGGAPRFHVARVNVNGGLDTTFDAGASFGTDAAGALGVVNAIKVQPDGKIAVGGRFNFVRGGAQNNVARLNADGSPDAAFNASATADDEVFTIALQADGRLVVGGFFAAVNGEAHNFAARLNADGTLDESFQTGVLTNGTVNAVATQADSKVIVGGDFTLINAVGRNRIARLTAEGSVDPGFNPGSGADGPIYAVALQPDGKVLVGGQFTSFDGVTRFGIARLNTDGSVDAKFAPDGTDGPVYAIALQGDDYILIGGDFGTVNGAGRHYLARLKPNGKLDGSFNPDAIDITGEAQSAPGGAEKRADAFSAGINGVIRAMVLKLNGTILIGGSFDKVGDASRPKIAQIKSNGKLDSSFKPAAGTDGTVRAVLAMDDGSVVIGGDFRQAGASSKNKIAKLRPDGSVDEGFNVDVGGTRAAARRPEARAAGAITRAAGDDGGSVNAMSANFGKIVMGGVFSRIADAIRNQIARVDAGTGQVDPAFDAGSGPNRAVMAVQAQADGKTLVGGSFDSVDRAPRNSVARLLGDEAAPDTAVSIMATESDVPETGAEDPGQFIVTRTGAMTTPLSVAYAIRGSAKSGINYKAITGHVTIPAGSSGAPILIRPKNDGRHTGKLKVKLVLQAGDGYALGSPRKAVVVILDAQ